MIKRSIVIGIAVAMASCGGQQTSEPARDLALDGGNESGPAKRGVPEGALEFNVRNLLEENATTDAEGHTIDVQVCGVPVSGEAAALFSTSGDLIAVGSAAFVQLIDLYHRSFCVNVATELGSGEEAKMVVRRKDVRKLSKGRMMVWVTHSNQYSPIAHPCWVYPRPFDNESGPDATIGYTVDVTAVHRASYACEIRDVSLDD